MPLPSTPFLRKTALALAFAFSTPLIPTAHAAAEAYIGELFLFSGNFCPSNTAPAAGQTLPINQNAALFSILGTTYGGNGVNNFQLPDLRGRVPIGTGGAPGLSSFVLGEAGGREQLTLTPSQLPAHTHTVSNMPASTQGATHSTPGPNRMLAQAQNAGIYREGGTADTSLSSTTSVGVTGNNQPVPIRDPFLSMQWCIVLNGNFPPRD